MNELLKMSVEASVRLRILELRRLPREEVFAEASARREEWVELITSKADILMYGGGKSGEVARVHTALCDALAHLAFVPGGVKFMDLHYEEV